MTAKTMQRAVCNLRYCGTNIATILSHYRIIALSHYRIIIIINIIYCFKTIIIVIVYVHAGKTRGTARGVRRRWRRCRICVSLCRPAGRSCPLSVAGGAVCRGSVTGDGDGGARAPARTKGKLARAPIRRGCAPPNQERRRGGCRTPHVDDVSRPSAESLKNVPSPTTHSLAPNSRRLVPVVWFSRNGDGQTSTYIPLRSSTPDTGCRNRSTAGFPGKQTAAAAAPPTTTDYPLPATII